MKLKRNNSKKPAIESAAPSLGQLDGVVVNGGGPVNTTNFKKDFEDAAKRLRELIKIGDTPTVTGKKVKAEQLDIDPGGTPNPSKIPTKKKGSAKESLTYQVIMGITDDGERKWYVEDDSSWTEDKSVATKYANPDKTRNIWIELTKGGRKLPKGFRRVLTPNYSASESIASRNTQKRPNKKDSSNFKVVKYSKEAYEAAATELKATLPPEYLNDPSEVNFKKIIKKKMEDELEAKRQAEKEAFKQRAKDSSAKLFKKVEDAQSIDDKMDILFEELVPNSGKAETVAGEAIRAMMRILYRDYNAGDVFYDGYGLETAGPSAEYLMDNYPLKDDFIEIADRALEDQAYTDAITNIAAKLINHLMDNPELFYDENEDDSRDWDISIVEKYRPMYDFGGDLPEGFVDFMGRQSVAQDISDWEVSGCGNLGHCADEINVWSSPNDRVEIIGIPREVYDELENNWDNWADDYVKDSGFNDSDSDDENNLDAATNEMLDDAYEGAYFTITGAGGDLEEWKEGVQGLLDQEKIGKISKWITFKGSDMNEKYHLTGSTRYPDDLTFLAFPLDGLDTGKLAMFKLRFDARWFNDIVDNNKRRN